MSKIKKIVLGYDFSKPSEAALKSAIYKADHFQAELIVVHALPTEIAVPYVPEVAHEMQEEIHKNLNEEVHKFIKASKHKLKKVHVEVMQGEVHEVLIEKASELKADLIMAGSHGHSVLSSIFLGSSAVKLVRFSPLPVYIDRSPLRENVKTILLPIDDPKNAEDIVEKAQIFAKAYQAEIQLFHVVDIREYYYAEYLTLVESATEEAQKDLQAIAKKQKMKLKPIVQVGSPTHRILEEANKNQNIRLIAMLTHASSGWNRFLLGSVAESVLRQAPCSVLTVRSEEVKKEMSKIFEKGVLLS